MHKNSDHSELENPEMKDNAFQVPEGYFDTLHEVILAQSEPSILDEENLRENIFKTPEGYFDSSSKLITEQFEEQIKVIPLYSRNWILYAAAVAALIVIFIFGMKSDDTVSNYEYANLSDELIIEYLLDEEISNLDILASIDDGQNILNELYEDEMGSLEYLEYDNPEMEYDFEYAEY
jgi:hypothetical protein